MAVAPSRMSGAEYIQFTALLRNQNAVMLAAAIITASGRPHSIQQALDIVRDVYFAQNPEPGSGNYQEWAKTKNERLAKIHGA